MNSNGNLDNAKPVSLLGSLEGLVSFMGSLEGLKSKRPALLRAPALSGLHGSIDLEDAYRLEESFMGIDDVIFVIYPKE